MRKRSQVLGTISVSILIIGVQAISAWATEPPKRIVSTIPSVTEILYALGLEERLVGVSQFCLFPPEAQEKEKVGAFHDPNLEKIIALRPDWIALFGRQDKIEAVMRPLGCEIYTHQDYTTRDVFGSIEEIAKIFSVEDRAAKLITQITTEVADLQERLSPLPRKKVLYVVGRNPGTLQQLFAVGRETFMHEILEAAKCENCVSSSYGKFPILSRETLIVSNPEVILDMAATEREVEQGIMPPEWKALASVSAVRNGRIIPVGDMHLTIPGPSIPETIRKVALLVHGEAAAQLLDEVKGD